MQRTTRCYSTSFLSTVEDSQAVLKFNIFCQHYFLIYVKSVLILIKNFLGGKIAVYYYIEENKNDVRIEMFELDEPSLNSEL